MLLQQQSFGRMNPQVTRMTVFLDISSRWKKKMELTATFSHQSKTAELVHESVTGEIPSQLQSLGEIQRNRSLPTPFQQKEIASPCSRNDVLTPSSFSSSSLPPVVRGEESIKSGVCEIAASRNREWGGKRFKE